MVDQTKDFDSKTQQQDPTGQQRQGETGQQRGDNPLGSTGKQDDTTGEKTGEQTGQDRGSETQSGTDQAGTGGSEGFIGSQSDKSDPQQAGFAEQGRGAPDQGGDAEQGRNEQGGERTANLDSDIEGSSKN